MFIDVYAFLKCFFKIKKNKKNPTIKETNNVHVFIQVK